MVDVSLNQAHLPTERPGVTIETKDYILRPRRYDIGIL